MTDRLELAERVEKASWRHWICFFVGHTPSGEFASSMGRTWQRCAYCDGWLGWMFHWKKRWRP